MMVIVYAKCSVSQSSTLCFVIMLNVVLLSVLALSKMILGVCNLLISLLCQDVSNRAKKLYRIAPSISDLIIVLTGLKKF
jgi:hypothetical protein